VRSVPILVLVLLAVFSACGGAAATTTTGDADADVSKAEYIARADAICGRAGKAVNGLHESTPIGDVLEQSAKLFGQALLELEALRRPSPGDAQLREWFRLQHEEIAVFPGFSEAVDDHDDAKFDALSQQAAKIESQARKVAKRFGFHACAQ
jgi:hypothetical protein